MGPPLAADRQWSHDMAATDPDEAIGPDTTTGAVSGVARLEQSGRWYSWIVTQLSQGYGFAASKGSFKAGHGMAAWILEGHSSMNRLVQKTITPGEGDDHTMFWSELCSLLSILLPDAIPHDTRFQSTKMPSCMQWEVGINPDTSISTSRCQGTTCRLDLGLPGVDTAMHIQTGMTSYEGAPRWDVPNGAC